MATTATLWTRSASSRRSTMRTVIPSRRPRRRAAWPATTSWMVTPSPYRKPIPPICARRTTGNTPRTMSARSVSRVSTVSSTTTRRPNTTATTSPAPCTCTATMVRGRLCSKRPATNMISMATRTCWVRAISIPTTSSPPKPRVGWVTSVIPSSWIWARSIASRSTTTTPISATSRGPCPTLGRT